jgi:hypothetical protein
MLQTVLELCHKNTDLYHIPQHFAKKIPRQANNSWKNPIFMAPKSTSP